MTNDSMGKIINASSQTDLFHKFQDAHHDIGPLGNKLLRQ
jgi:hypothetical protein